MDAAQIKQLSEATTDEELPELTEQDIVDISRVIGMFDIVDAKNNANEPGKLKKEPKPVPEAPEEKKNCSKQNKERTRTVSA